MSTIFTDIWPCDLCDGHNEATLVLLVSGAAICDQCISGRLSYLWEKAHAPRSIPSQSHDPNHGRLPSKFELRREHLLTGGPCL